MNGHWSPVSGMCFDTGVETDWELVRLASQGRAALGHETVRGGWNIPPWMLWFCFLTRYTNGPSRPWAKNHHTMTSADHARWFELLLELARHEERMTLWQTAVGLLPFGAATGPEYAEAYAELAEKIARGECE